MINNFVLVKLSGFTRDGLKLSSRESALALLKAGIWPMFSRTRNVYVIKVEDNVAIYLGGSSNQTIIGKAKVDKIVNWDREYSKNYPIVMDGVPKLVLVLKDIVVFDTPVSILDKLSILSFIPANKRKWGVAFMGGARKVNDEDFSILVGDTHASVTSKRYEHWEIDVIDLLSEKLDITTSDSQSIVDAQPFILAKCWGLNYSEDKTSDLIERASAGEEVEFNE